MDKRFSGVKILLLYTIICFLLLTLIITHNDLAFSKTPGFDIVLVIDSSGSMVETDPQNLRITAAKIFIDLLEPSDRVGEIDFDESVKILDYLTPVSTSHIKEKLKQDLEEINSKGDTDFLKALNAARNILNSDLEKDRKKVIIFLTDGKPHPNSKIDKDLYYRNKYMESLNNEITNLANSGIVVYSIGLSQLADIDLLREISRKTKGQYFIASKATDLNNIFTQIFKNLKNDRFENILTGTFNINPLVNNIYILSTREGPDSFVYLIDPDGNKIMPKSKNVYYAEGKFYQLYEIDNARVGSWSVKKQGDGHVSVWVLESLKIKLEVLAPKANMSIPINQNILVKAAVVSLFNNEAIPIDTSKFSMYVEAVPVNSVSNIPKISVTLQREPTSSLPQFEGYLKSTSLEPNTDYWLNFVLSYKNFVILTKKVLMYGMPSLPNLSLLSPKGKCILPSNMKVPIVVEVSNETSDSFITQCKAVISFPEKEQNEIVNLERKGDKFYGLFKVESIKDYFYLSLDASALLKNKETYRFSLPNLAQIFREKVVIECTNNNFKLDKSLSCNIPLQYKTILNNSTNMRFSIKNNAFAMEPNNFTLPQGLNKSGKILINVKLTDGSLIYLSKPHILNTQIGLNLENSTIPLNKSLIYVDIIIPSWIEIHKLLIFIVFFGLLLLLLVWLIRWIKSPSVVGVLVEDANRDNTIYLYSQATFFKRLLSKNTCTLYIEGNKLQFITERRIVSKEDLLSTDSPDDFLDIDGENDRTYFPFVTYVRLLHGELFINSLRVPVFSKKELAEGDSLTIGNKLYKFYYSY